MQLSNEELGKYLESVRKQKGYSTYDVNKLTDISQSYISLIEKGKRKASAVILKTLAPIYDLDYLDLYEKAGYVDLLEDENKFKFDKLGNPIVSLPLLGTVKAGYDYMAQENWEGTIDVEKSLIKDGSEYFALTVKGDSMFPVLIEGDIVIIKKQEDFETGDIVVAIVNGDEATIKKGKKTSNGILLQPLNTKYEPLIFTYDEMKTIPVIIVGIVKQLKRDF